MVTAEGATRCSASRPRCRCLRRRSPLVTKSPEAYDIAATSSGDSAGYHRKAAGLTRCPPTFTASAARRLPGPARQRLSGARGACRCGPNTSTATDTGDRRARYPSRAGAGAGMRPPRPAPLRAAPRARRCGRRGIMMHGEIPATSPTTGDMHDLRRSARTRSPSAALPSPSIQARRVAPASQTAFAEIPSAGRAPSNGPRPVGRVTVLSTRDRPFVASPFRAPTGQRFPPPRVRAGAGGGLRNAAPQRRHARDVYLSPLEELLVVFSSILPFCHLWQFPLRHLWQFLLRLWTTLWIIRSWRGQVPASPRLLMG